MKHADDVRVFRVFRTEAVRYEGKDCLLVSFVGLAKDGANYHFGNWFGRNRFFAVLTIHGVVDAAAGGSNYDQGLVWLDASVTSTDIDRKAPRGQDPVTTLGYALAALLNGKFRED